MQGSTEELRISERDWSILSGQNVVEADPEDKKFSIWVDLRFQPSKAERRKIYRVLHGAQDDLKSYFERVADANVSERDGILENAAGMQ
jgi:hypothetical protein